MLNDYDDNNLDYNNFSSYSKNEERKRLKKRKRYNLYNSVMLYDASLNAICCIMGLITRSNKFYIAALACIISYLIIMVVNTLDN